MIIIVVDGVEQKISACPLSTAVEALGLSEDHIIRVNDVKIPIDAKLMLFEGHRVIANSPSFEHDFGSTESVESTPVAGQSDTKVIRLMVYRTKTVPVNEKPQSFKGLPPKKALRYVRKVLDLNPETGELNEVFAQ